jgi:hypothetical protein
MVSSEEKSAFEGLQLQCLSALGDSDKNSLQFVYEFPGNMSLVGVLRESNLSCLARLA